MLNSERITGGTLTFDGAKGPVVVKFTVIRDRTTPLPFAPESPVIVFRPHSWVLPVSEEILADPEYSRELKVVITDSCLEDIIPADDYVAHRLANPLPGDTREDTLAELLEHESRDVRMAAIAAVSQPPCRRP